MAKLSVLFAGQGSQYLGMGVDVLNTYEWAAQLENQASTFLGYSIKSVLNEDSNRLNDTLFTQPAIVFTSILLWDLVRPLCPTPIHSMAGFSLGEYTALHAADVFSFIEIMKLIHIRAYAMQTASMKIPGMMAAILGVENDSLSEWCEEARVGDEAVYLANLNCPGQTVVSGHSHAVNRLIENAKLKGARRAIPLSVSGAFHSPYMEPAQVALKQALDQMNPRIPGTSVYMNVNATPLRVDQLSMSLVDQLVSPVLFENTIRHMIKDGTTHFIEIGPGSVLSGFVRKIDSQIPCFSINKIADVEGLKGWITTHGLS